MIILGEIISTIGIGILLSIGLWCVCYLLLKSLYPRYSFELRHHLFSLLIAVMTFVLYCFFSTVSATISGVEYAMDSAKALVVKNGDLADKLSTAFLSGADQQTLLTEINQSITALQSNKELAKYMQDIDLSEITRQDMAAVLSTPNIPVKEQAIQLIDQVFDSYISMYTRRLNKAWWGLLIALILTQLTYFGIMLYRADAGSKRRQARRPTDYRSSRARRRR